MVFCAGVLYHHPSPFDLLVALRRICRETLILRTSTIPEVRGPAERRGVFSDARCRGRASCGTSRRSGSCTRPGSATSSSRSDGYGNWFWGLTPSCLESLLKTAGFRVDFRATEAFAQTVVCTAVAPALEHRLPDQFSARRARGGDLGGRDRAGPA